MDTDRTPEILYTGSVQLCIRTTLPIGKIIVCHIEKYKGLDDPLDGMVTISEQNTLLNAMASFDSRDLLPRRWLLHS